MRYIIAFLLFLSINLYAEDKDWTFVVWMNGDNNLCPYTKQNLKDLRTKNISNTTNLIVVFDCDEENDSAIYKLSGKWWPKKNITSKFTPLKEFDMGNAKFFEETTNAIFNAYPAKYKMLVMWNHGSGWMDSARIPTRGISYDDSSNSFITTKEFFKSLSYIAATNHLSILGFDACLMQMAEIIYELASYTDYVIGSEDTEPNRGWNYAALINNMSDWSFWYTPYRVGDVIVHKYFDASENLPYSMTMSMVDTRFFVEFVKYLKPVVDKLTGKNITQNILNTTYFYIPEYRDLGVFLEQFPNLPEAQNALAMYKQAVIYNKSNGDATGISVYLPVKNMLPEYSGLKFAQDTGWDKLLDN